MLVVVKNKLGYTIPVGISNIPYREGIEIYLTIFDGLENL